MAGNTDFWGRSHSTALTLAFQAMLDDDRLVILGGEYDAAKANAYEADLTRIKVLAVETTALADAVAAVLPAADEAE